jgi:hypothetical protein
VFDRGEFITFPVGGGPNPKLVWVRPTDHDMRLCLLALLNP